MASFPFADVVGTPSALLPPRRTGARRRVPAPAAADRRGHRVPAGPHRARELHRGLPREGGPRRPGRHQPADQDPAAEPRDALRRDAGGCRRADGRRHPARDPASLDELAEHRPATLRSTSRGPRDAEPARALRPRGVRRRRPRPNGAPGVPPDRLLALVGHHAAEEGDRRDRGFVVEAPPPAATTRRRAAGPTSTRAARPIYGERDRADLQVCATSACRSGWPASGHSPPRCTRRWRSAPPACRSGTLFAFCEESGLDAGAQAAGHDRARTARPTGLHRPGASPTGFPFKVLELPATLSEAEVYEQRTRVCDLGYLRQAYRTEDGTVGYRCAAEPVADYVAKGGDARTRSAASACATR